MNDAKLVAVDSQQLHAKVQENPHAQTAGSDDVLEIVGNPKYRQRQAAVARHFGNALYEFSGSTGTKVNSEALNAVTW